MARLFKKDKVVTVYLYTIFKIHEDWPTCMKVRGCKVKKREKNTDRWTDISFLNTN